MFSALKDQLIKAGLAPPTPVEAEKPKPAERGPQQRGAGQNRPAHVQAHARSGAADPRSAAQQRHAQPNRGAQPSGPAQANRGAQPARSARPQPQTKPASGEVDLRVAFAERQRAEQAERDAQRRAAEEESRLKKAQRAQLKHLLGQHTVLNDPAAEIARNFLWGRKIRRTYVTADQLKAVNAGELGIVAMDGRFSLYPAEVVRAVQVIDKHAVGLLVDPNAPVDEPDYDDPRYQVPDDLVW